MQNIGKRERFVLGGRIDGAPLKTMSYIMRDFNFPRSNLLYPFFVEVTPQSLQLTFLLKWGKFVLTLCLDKPEKR
ncbi:TPA: hypothetical protein ACS72K_004029, partial [Providencia alcalifaciens]